MNIEKNLRLISKSKRVLFTTPSHDKTSFVIPDIEKFIGRKFFYHDLSEINGLDNLANPENSILYAMQKSAEKIGVNKVFYLINGSSSGIVSAMLSLLKDGDKVLVARNCHKSVLNGLILSGAEPVWFIPEINKDWDIFNSVNPDKIENLLSQNKGIKAVIITSPTYEGVSSNISLISEICHKHNTFLIVDEAHGALKSFAPEFFGENAVKLSADIAVQSLHKTCGAPNPCAIMLCGENINSQKIQNSLNLINTTSPSFPFIAAIEATIDYLFSKDGKLKINQLIKNIDDLKNDFSDVENIEFCNFNDKTKLLLKINGLSGFDLSDILYDEFNIEDELTNNKASLLLTGIGTSKHKLNLLKKAIKTILSTNYTYPKIQKICPVLIPNSKITPREAYFAEKETILTSDACGKICGEVISEYPPGIPLLIPGEIISKEQIEYLKNKKSEISVCKYNLIY